MKNTQLFSHQNPKSIHIGSLITGPFPNGRLVLCPDYCPLEIYMAMSSRYLLMDDNCKK